MKSSVCMLAVLAAMVAQAKADGVCYDPKHNNGANLNTIAADMKLIKERGFSMVRTYISKIGNENMAKVVASSGLAATLGVPYVGDYADALAHADAAIEAANSGNVQNIMVGNENLMGPLGNIPEMIRLINYIKGKVGGKARVGTVQRSAELSTSIPAGMSELINACDIVGTNIHPFFHPCQQVDTAIEETKRQWRGILNSGLPGIAGKLILTETGWPSAGCIGSTCGSTCGSVEGAAKYWNAYKAWGEIPNDKRHYFQAFDQPYRAQVYEKAYGIWNADGTIKVNAQGNAQQVAPATTAPATTTPPPTKKPDATSAPPSATPVANATSNATTTHSAAGSKTTGSSSLETGVETLKPADIENIDITTAHSLAMEDTADHHVNAPKQSDAESETIPEASSVETRSAATGGGFTGVFIMAIMGVGIVAVAAGFIYKARQKAAELDRESKGDALSITPGGACVL